MILKNPPFEDMVRKLHAHITLSQWKSLCEALNKAKGIDRKFIRVDDGFIRIDTSKYLEEEEYGPFEKRLRNNTSVFKTFTYDLKNGIRIVVRFNYGPTLGQVWDLEASHGDYYSIRVPMLRKDGCYAGASNPLTPQLEARNRRSKR